MQNFYPSSCNPGDSLAASSMRVNGTRSEVARTTAAPQLKSIAEILLAIAMQRSGSSPEEAGG